MEKIRRERIKNSLDQLRTLLPRSETMKKDMASLLEQTVEYINIMHTVLNEDKPICLDKIYQIYHQKTEQIERLRKTHKKLRKHESRNPSLGGRASLPMDFDPFSRQCSSVAPYFNQFYHNGWTQPPNFDCFMQSRPTPNFNHENPFDQNTENAKFYSQECVSSQQAAENEAESSVEASSSQDSTAETSNNQPETAGIEAAAMATGVLDSCSQKEEESRGLGLIEQHKQCFESWVNIPETWVNSNCSLPPMSLGQPCYKTCELQQ